MCMNSMLRKLIFRNLTSIQGAPWTIDEIKAHIYVQIIAVPADLIRLKENVAKRAW